MRYCLWCHEELVIQTNWTTVINVDNDKTICTQCENSLEEISGSRCHYCSRKSLENKCTDCQEWDRMYDGADPLNKNFSIYSYNEYMKEVIAKWKYRGDYVLGEMFKELFVQRFHQHFFTIRKNAVIMSIPLSKERLFERGFNQAFMLATFLTAKVNESLQRVHNEKQSKKSRRERLKTTNPFNLTKPINKPVILVDDIYTTGQTIRHAASVLKRNGCPQVYAYTLIRG